MKLPPSAGHPYRALAAEVVAKIRRGDLRPDDKLPSVRVLAKEYGVTMATAQRAVQQLALDGYVRTVPNLGSFVLTQGAEIADAGTVTADAVNRRVDELQAAMADLEVRVRHLESTSVATTAERPAPRR